VLLAITCLINIKLSNIKNLILDCYFSRQTSVTHNGMIVMAESTKDNIPMHSGRCFPHPQAMPFKPDPQLGLTPERSPLQACSKKTVRFTSPDKVRARRKVGAAIATVSSPLCISYCQDTLQLCSFSVTCTIRNLAVFCDLNENSSKFSGFCYLSR